jgi:hypothetical protein
LSSLFFLLPVFLFLLLLKIIFRERLIDFVLRCAKMLDTLAGEILLWPSVQQCA